MKKLVCAKDIEDSKKSGLSTFCIPENTIITPSAKDLADEYNIRFVKKEEDKQMSNENLTDLLSQNISKEQLLVLLKKILLDDAANQLPFDQEKHPNGLKVVRGKSVKMDVFETGNPDADVHFQELVSKDESQMSAGFLEIDHSSFEWNLTYEEIDYVIEGTLTVTIDGKTYTANAGDVLFVPKDTTVVWGSPDKAHVFYSTFPANWADLV
jgi:ethanolamine utilization protein EutQ